eukprot:1972066-Rhodomonas_salina.1
MDEEVRFRGIVPRAAQARWQQSLVPFQALSVLCLVSGLYLYGQEATMGYKQFCTASGLVSTSCNA